MPSDLEPSVFLIRNCPCRKYVRDVLVQFAAVLSDPKNGSLSMVAPDLRHDCPEGVICSGPVAALLSKEKQRGLDTIVGRPERLAREADRRDDLCLTADKFSNLSGR